MTDQQREKYAFIRGKLTDEHWAELERVTDILNRRKGISERRSKASNTT